jgi:hypothetical protein
MAKFRRLFWDLEISPNIGFFWKPGFKVRIPPENIIHENAIICASYKWEDEKKVHTLHWNRRKQCDKTLVKQFCKVLMSADEAVAHNGDQFDMKYFLGRCLIHKLPAPPETKTVDTLVIARRRFRLNSNKLDYIAQVLGHGMKHDTSFSLWKDIVLNDCDKSLNKMIKYCEQDVKLLEKIYHEMANFHNPKTHVGVVQGKDKWTCPACGSEDVIRRRTRYTVKGTPRIDMSCKCCGRWYMISERDHKHYVEAKA